MGTLDSAEFPSLLGKWLAHYIPARDYALIAFSANARPRILHTDIDGFDATLGIYAKGAYLLDPFYRAYTSGRRGYMHLKELMPGELEEEAFFSQDHRWVGSVDEAGYLTDADATTCLHVSLSPETADEPFDASCRAHLAEAEPLVAALLDQFWARQGFSVNPDERRIHQQLVSAVSLFGSDTLTPRECDIVQLMLRGHSAKSTARELEISPGTVNLHRSHIYQKLDVSNQGELFSLFLDALVNGDLFRGGDILVS